MNLVFNHGLVFIQGENRGGHQPTRPVSKGIAPIKNHILEGPQKAKEIKKAPIMILAIRSMFPIFVFILTPLKDVVKRL